MAKISTFATPGPGGLGNDKLLGGAENDFLQGGGGLDTLTGGGGDDRFVFFAEDLDAKTFITDYREGNNIFFQFLFFFGFEDLEITHGSGKTFIEADTPSGQLQIELNGTHNLDEGDFTFVIEND